MAFGMRGGLDLGQASVWRRDHRRQLREINHAARTISA
jgi:hypothetical protein